MLSVAKEKILGGIGAVLQRSRTRLSSQTKISGVQDYTRYCMVIIFFSLGLRLVFICSNNLLVEESYYWNYAAHLDVGYLDHPPMVALLIKSAEMLLGFGEWVIRMPTLICWM